MVFALGILYILVLLHPFFKKRKDFFSPPILFAITMAFYTLPDVVSILIDGTTPFTSNLPFNLVNKPDYLISRFLLIQIIFVVCYYIGFNSFLSKVKKTRISNLRDASNKRLNLFLTVIGLSLALYLTISFINKIGGFQALFLSFTDRDQLAESKTFFQDTAPILLTMSTAFGIKYMAQSKKNNWFMLLVIVIIGFIVQTSGGGRSGFVVFLISILCYYNYLKKSIHLFSVKFLPLYLGIAVFIIAFQLLRFEDTNDLSVSLLREHSDSLFSSMSYVKTQLLIQNYFDTHSFWFGRIFTFLIYMFIPRSICPNKPYMDEGVYIYNMIQGGSRDVLMSTDYYNSWPPFTAGIAYANGGVIGIVIGALILSLIHAYAYKAVKDNGASIFVLIVYVFVALKFQITIFYICNVVYLLIEVWLTYKLYKIIDGRKKRLKPDSKTPLTSNGAL